MHKKARSTSTVKSMSRNKGSAQIAYKIRRWILLAVSKAGANGGVTINHIKKYLDSKVKGLSNRPEVKIVLKKALSTGHLARVDGKYVCNAKPLVNKLGNENSAAVIKVLEEAVERDAAVQSAPDSNCAQVKRLSRGSTTQTENKKRAASGGGDGSASSGIKGNAELREGGDNFVDSSVPVGDVKAEKTKKKRKYKKRATDGDGTVSKSTLENRNETVNSKALHGAGDAAALSCVPASDQTVAPKRKRSRAASAERN